MTTLRSAEEAAWFRRNIYTHNSLLIDIHNTLSLHMIAEMKPNVHKRNNIDIFQSTNFLLEIIC